MWLACYTKLMKILAIETSCDDTSVAIVENGRSILANMVSSQIKSHQVHGGVVPELASRLHTEKINMLIDLAFKKSELSYSDIQAIAVTHGPGLEGSLLIGLIAAKAIALGLNLPLVGVNHLHGHLYASFLGESAPQFPFIGLIVSGGHTDLVLVKDHFNIEKLGATRDDAAGEAFDKVARALGLGYPGGPLIEKEALNGNPKAFAFPRAMKNQGLDFSFSGLKTAVMQTLAKLKVEEKPIIVEDVCASFQQAVSDTLVSKTLEACRLHSCQTLVVCGGVSANQAIKAAFAEACSKNGITVHCPEPVLCTDNAAMIGAAAYFAHQQGYGPTLPFGVNPNLSITAA
jgi:N6-L-threonylcarbamoyladenine synthase